MNGCVPISTEGPFDNLAVQLNQIVQ
jgi:hypothetical protein